MPKYQGDLTSNLSDEVQKAARSRGWDSVWLKLVIW